MIHAPLTSLWAKLRRNADSSIAGWHGLVAHSCDVAAVMEALLREPTLSSRLSVLAERPLDAITIARLCALAFLHDVGKASRGFQARTDPHAPIVGHIDPVAWLFLGSDAAGLFRRFERMLHLDQIETWFAADPSPLIEAVFAHHGAPWNRDGCDCRKLWCPETDGDPIAGLAAMAAAMLSRYPAAFGQGPALPAAPAFHHAYAGLLMLADWLASDEAFFPFRNGAEPSTEQSREAAASAIAAVGLDAAVARAAFRPGSFHAAFGNQPRGLQSDIATPDARCVVLEAETGSGKTEAALWRFKTLFEQGAVDGLYFALPTRVAATAMFARVKTFRDAVFGPGGPAVVLAVPGQAAVDEAEGRPLPNFGFEWTDHAEGDAARRRWAAEHPKRFLAAPIAVGTIDQALLGAIRVKHSQMRGAALMRHLLVVDEVHASDSYMSVLLSALLQNHGQAGGHALLLSATLGAAARSRFLGVPCPTAVEAEAVAYPALSWNSDGQEHRLVLSGAPPKAKSVAVDPLPALDRPDHVAALVLAAADAGARVLVIRNTVRAAVATMQAIVRLAPEHASLFRVEGKPTLHHGRFSRPDRRMLDYAVEATLGRRSPPGGRILVGTQTLEVSLDLDADLLVTDLCPADVMLQRIGRLHRHPRARPFGYEVARAIVLVPEARDLKHFATRAGGRHGLGLVYDDLRIIEATWRLMESSPIWTIPADNRRLVERSTHPEHLARIEQELSRDPILRDHLHRRTGRGLAGVGNATAARLLWSSPFTELSVPTDERLGTRLGTMDRQVDLPAHLLGAFRLPVLGLKIPHYLTENIPLETEPTGAVQHDDGVAFRLGDVCFVYDQWGLRLDDPAV